MENLIDICSYPVITVLDTLLEDKTTKQNIIWATDSYKEYGNGYSDKDQITKHALLNHPNLIRPRISKSQEAQAARTRKKAEVFTPAWLCNVMNNYCDSEWFEKENVFNIENSDNTWSVQEDKIEFPQVKRRKKPSWQYYVDSRRLEITCGEAPYLVSRYDVSTGKSILPLNRRIGQLDRKLRIVNENTNTQAEWLKWTQRAFEAVYGYEFQGDNLLLARINLLLTFVDYFVDRWSEQPDDNLLHKFADIITWNIWQMDGLNDIVPLGKPQDMAHQLSLFDMYTGEIKTKDTEPETIPCKIKNARGKKILLFKGLKERNTMGKKLFDYVIGNPPYQEETKNNGRQSPVYNIFMDAAFEIAECVVLIHPARFLFNAGQTPKRWNEKLLNDNHFKVLQYEANATKIFPSTEIKGGGGYYN